MYEDEYDVLVTIRAMRQSQGSLVIFSLQWRNVDQSKGAKLRSYASQVVNEIVFKLLGNRAVIIVGENNKWIEFEASKLFE